MATAELELELITKALIKGQASRVKTLTLLAMENGVSPQRIFQQALLPGMQVIGSQFRDKAIYISDVLIASRAMHAGLHALKPVLSQPKHSSMGKVVIGTVAGDLHDIGKNLIVMMFRSVGFEVIDLGIDVQTEDFMEAVKKYHPNILALSAMLTTTLPMMPEAITELERLNLRDSVKIIIGGNPATQEFAESIKADGYAVDVFKAVDLAVQLVQ